MKKIIWLAILLGSPPASAQIYGGGADLNGNAWSCNGYECDGAGPRGGFSISIPRPSPQVIIVPAYPQTAPQPRPPALCNDYYDLDAC